MLTVLVLTIVVGFALNMPISFALGIASLLCVLTSTLPPAIIPQRMVAGANYFPLLAIPFFMLAGTIMDRGGVSRRIVALASALVGHIRGGLAAVSILACTFFAAISGSTPATAAAVGSITIPEMEKRGYDRVYSAAVVASSSCLGVIIPPSITMVVFGVIADVSVGKLLLGGILPGFFLAFLLICANAVYARIYKFPSEQRQNLRQIWVAFRDALWGLLMPIIIMGGIMTGVVTPTESAVIAVVYGLIVSLFVYREMKFKDLIPVFYRAALSSGILMFLVICANPFGWLMTVLRIPQEASAAMLTVSDNWVVLYLLMVAIYLILGTFMETGAILFLIVPIFVPIARSLGLDMVHFGVITVISLAIGMVTPPVGIALFATCGIGKVGMAELSKRILPFIGVLIFGLLCLVYIPFITTVIPDIVFP